MATAFRRPASETSLPADRAFVVQIGARRPGGRATLAGRVEHLISGRARRFETAEELLAFVATILGTLDADITET